MEVRPGWKRHWADYGWVCVCCGYHGRHQIGREIHERTSWPEKCEGWKSHLAETNQKKKYMSDNTKPNSGTLTIAIEMPDTNFMGHGELLCRIGDFLDEADPNFKRRQKLRVSWEPAAEDEPEEGKFTDEMVEYLLNISNDLAEGGDPNSYSAEELATLAEYLADEVAKIPQHFHEVLANIALLALQGMKHEDIPEQDDP